MAGDALYANVSLLLHANGADASTVFTDSSPSPKVISLIGTPTISTAQSKFGGSSILLNSSSSLTIPPGSGIGTLTADFTLEAWIFLTSSGQDSHQLLDTRTSGGTASPWVVTMEKIVGGIYVVGFFDGTPHNGVTEIPINTWTHVAVCRSGSTIRTFTNGAVEHTYTSAATLAGTTTAVISLGGKDIAQYKFVGHIDELRVTQGAARYTAAFTPPTAAFPEASEITGTVLGPSGTPVARTVRAYRRSDGALMASAVSNATTGAYLLSIPTSAEMSVVTFDNADTGTFYNDRVIRVIPV